MAHKVTFHHNPVTSLVGGPPTEVEVGHHWIHYKHTTTINCTVSHVLTHRGHLFDFYSAERNATFPNGATVALTGPYLFGGKKYIVARTTHLPRPVMVRFIHRFHHQVAEAEEEYDEAAYERDAAQAEAEPQE